MDRQTGYGYAETPTRVATVAPEIHGALGNRALCEHVRTTTSLFLSLALAAPSPHHRPAGNIQRRLENPRRVVDRVFFQKGHVAQTPNHFLHAFSGRLGFFQIRNDRSRKKKKKHTFPVIRHTCDILRVRQGLPPDKCTSTDSIHRSRYIHKPCFLFWSF